MPIDIGELEAAGWRQIAADGFIELIGPFWTKENGKELLMGFIATEKHKNRSGVVQGGMLATLADRAMGMACRSSNNGKSQATIQLDVHYLDAAQIGEFVEARCRVVRRTRFVIFAEAEISSAERVIATAKGIWKVKATTAPSVLSDVQKSL